MMPVFKTELDGKDEVLVCLHWRTFPPWNKSAFPDKTPTQAWGEGRIDANEYQRALIWERICNKFSMDDACRDCEMVRKMVVHNHQPAMMSLDGTNIVPTTDVPTIDVLPRNRSPLIEGGPYTRGTRTGARKK
jgi:hypothetical protein